MLEQDPQKMKWKLTLRIATSSSERWLRKAAEMEPTSEFKIWNKQSDWKTEKKMGR